MSELFSWLIDHALHIAMIAATVAIIAAHMAHRACSRADSALERAIARIDSALAEIEIMRPSRYSSRTVPLDAVVGPR